MKKQTRLSRLTIAASLVLAASATCFAQSEPTESRTESTGPVAVALNAMPKFEAPGANYSSPTASSNEKRTGFSAAKFIESAKQSVTNSKLSFVPPTVIESKTEFSMPVETKKITFVPSRGPWLPK